ncbi:hypothetical protein HU200_029014 [Digitaria exilis]|uniref:Uncharacterized protein n=1 Tax=Digitaria exilis TaxID=1010633 RepID=A0A835BUK9_9POAL|nr:hypothetical protein HU200_029014 [Digitaria exilis]
MKKWLAEPPSEGEEPKSKTQVVAEVPEQTNKKNTFLQNVGMQIVQPRPNTQDVAAQLEREKMENAELLSIVNNQRKQLEKADQARIRMEEMSKRCPDLEAKVDLLLGANPPS